MGIKPHEISVAWLHGRRVTAEAEQRGKDAAMEALATGLSYKQAVALCIATMFEGRQPEFEGLTVIIDGDSFGE